MTGRTTVWYFVPALSVGGTEQTLVDLANGLDRDRYDVTVWTIFDQNPLAPELKDWVALRTLGAQGTAPGDQDHYVSRAENPFDYVRAPLRFLLAVRREKPNILQSFLFFDNVISRLARVASPETTIISGVRSVENDPNGVQALLDRLTMPLADYVVSNSKAGADHAVARGAPTDRVEVIWNGRDVDAYGTTDADGLRDELGIAADEPVVGTVGRLIERKGHHDLVDAWPAVRTRHPEAHLVIVGDGPEHDALRRRIAATDCPRSIRLTGIRDDVPAFLSMFDVFAFPSYFEGLPGALIEAMAAELPIVTTPVDGCAELVENYEHGLHVEVGQPNTLSWALARLLENSDFAADLGDRAGLRARQRCTIERMVAEFDRLYESIV